MQINTQYNNYQSKTQEIKKEEKTNKSESSKDFSSQISEKKESKKSDILIYLDRNNAFAELNEKDATLFRELLSDNTLDDSDMRRLSFEQTQKMRDFILKDREGDGSLPIVSVLKGKSFQLLTASTFTGDNKFNKALYDTVSQTEDLRVIADYFSILWDNLSQKIAGKEILPAYVKNSPYDSIGANFGPHNKDIVNINFDAFLNDYTKKLQDKLDETYDNIDIFKQFKKDFNFYSKLLNNYNKYD